MSGPAVCGRCVAKGGGCCTSEPGIFGPPLTSGDERRIAQATGRERTQFVQVRDVDPEEVLAWEADVPSLKGLCKGGIVRSLARPAGRCLLLGPRGCTLPPEAKPLLCQLFPFEVAGQALRVQPAGDCLAVEESHDLPSLARLLRTSARQLVQLDVRVREELSAATVASGRSDTPRSHAPPDQAPGARRPPPSARPRGGPAA